MTGRAFLGAISSDDRWLVSRKFFAQELTLWDITTGKEVRGFKGMKGLPLSIQFSDDDQKIGVHSTEGETIIWDRETAKILKQVKDSKVSLKNLLN
ncbi:MAG: hypothetical protein AB8F34_09350 [Akkermansiaceae bacterium]